MGMGVLVTGISGIAIISDPSPVIIFAAPTLARCTTSFLSPNCIPLRPWIACRGGGRGTQRLRDGGGRGTQRLRDGGGRGTQRLRDGGEGTQRLRDGGGGDTATQRWGGRDTAMGRGGTQRLRDGGEGDIATQRCQKTTTENRPIVEDKTTHPDGNSTQKDKATQHNTNPKTDFFMNSTLVGLEPTTAHTL